MRRFHYELQEKAQKALVKAIKGGILERKPCEVCGDERSMAHHDSYCRDKWLTVRFLCSSHHGQWHAKNEPEYPEEDSVKLEERLFLDKVEGVVRGGRRAKPWLRKQTGNWYIKVDGKPIRIGRTEDEALKNWEAIKAAKVAGNQTVTKTSLSVTKRGQETAIVA